MCRAHGGKMKKLRLIVLLFILCVIINLLSYAGYFGSTHDITIEVANLNENCKLKIGYDGNSSWGDLGVLVTESCTEEIFINNYVTRLPVYIINNNGKTQKIKDIPIESEVNMNGIYIKYDGSTDKLTYNVNYKEDYIKEQEKEKLERNRMILQWCIPLVIIIIAIILLIKIGGK